MMTPKFVPTLIKGSETEHCRGSLILIVDKKQEDRTALIDKLRCLGVQNPIAFLEDGQSAIHYLKGNAPYSDRDKHPLPGILFLELALPVITGWTVLDWIRTSKAQLKRLVCVQSNFTHAPGVQRVFFLGAHSLLKKPIDELELMNLIYHFPRYWSLQPST